MKTQFLKIIVYLLLVLSPLSVFAISLGTQTISITPTTPISVGATGDTFTLTVSHSYERGDRVSNDVNTIGFRFHYNSSILAVESINDLYTRNISVDPSDGLEPDAPLPAFDNNPLTDRLVTGTWVNGGSENDGDLTIETLNTITCNDGTTVLEVPLSGNGVAYHNACVAAGSVWGEEVLANRLYENGMQTASAIVPIPSPLDLTEITFSWVSPTATNQATEMILEFSEGSMGRGWEFGIGVDSYIVNGPDTIAPTLGGTTTITATAIAENSGAGQVIYTARAMDANTVVYSLGSVGDASRFSINPTSGAITLTENPNFELRPSYQVQVIATDTSGNTAMRGVGLAITDVNELPGAVAILDAAGDDIGAESITLRWRAPSNTGPSITRFDVLRDGNNIGTRSFTAGTTAYSFIDTGLTEETTYAYVVRATSDEGTSNSPSVNRRTVNPDSDGDGIPDDVEIAAGLDPNNRADGALDPDDDGQTNAQELTAVPPTNINVDDYPPVITLTPNTPTLIATGRRTAFTFDTDAANSDANVIATAVDGKDGDVTPELISVDGDTPKIVDGNQLILTSGSHSLVWQATDAAGNTDTVTQMVEIMPLVSLSQSAQSGGSDYTVTIVLTGETVNRGPVTGSYTTTGATPTSGVIRINSGDRADSVNLTLNSGATTASFTISSVTNATLSGVATQIITRASAPRINSFSVTQGDAIGRVIRASSGDVTIVAETTGANNRTYAWMVDGVVNADATDTLVISEVDIPDSGNIVDVQLVLSDSSSSTTRTLQLRVVDATATVTVAAADTNNNGVVDGDESQVTAGIDLLIGTQTSRVITTSQGRITTGVIAGNYGGITATDITAFEEANRQIYSADSFTSGEIYDYSVENIGAGGTVSIVVELASAISNGASVRKYDIDLPGAGWGAFTTDDNNAYYSARVTQGASCPNAADSSWSEKGMLRAGDNCLRLDVQDGGANDSDDEANGVIDDPFTVASGGGAGGGGAGGGGGGGDVFGCTLTTNTSANNATLDPMLYILLGLALLALFRRKKANA